MQLNTRDTLSRRCSTFVWGGALMLGVCIVGILSYPLFQSETKEIDDYYQEHVQLKGELKIVHKKQAEKKASYQYDVNVAADKLAAEVAKEDYAPKASVK